MSEEYLAPVLCGGTFLTLLVKAKTEVAPAHEKTKGISYENSDGDVYKGLINVFFPYFEVSNTESFEVQTNNYKKCSNEAMRKVPFMNGTTVEKLKEEPLNKYNAWSMHEFVKQFIDESQKQELINSLVELIEKACNVPSEAEWCIGENTYVITKDIRNSLINIDWFLADVWRFIMIKSRNNRKGKVSYKYWFEKEELGNKKYCFASNIGYNNFQEFSLTEEKEKPQQAEEESEELKEITKINCEENVQENFQPTGSILNNQVMKLGQVLLDNFVPAIESIEKSIISKQDCSNNALYVSKYKEGELLALLNNGDIEPIQIDDTFSFDDICGDDYFEFTENCFFASTFAADMTRCVEVKIPMNGYMIVGRTSIENWNSKSYLDNLVYVGKCKCNGIFSIVGKNENMVIVQFIYIKR